MQTKGQVLHRTLLYLKLSGWLSDLSTLLSKVLVFLTCLNEISGSCEIKKLCQFQGYFGPRADLNTNCESNDQMAQTLNILRVESNWGVTICSFWNIRECMEIRKGSYSIKLEQNNLSAAEWATLQNLRTHKDIVIKAADKGAVVDIRRAHC